MPDGASWLREGTGVSGLGELTRLVCVCCVAKSPCFGLCLLVSLRIALLVQSPPFCTRDSDAECRDSAHVC